MSILVSKQEVRQYRKTGSLLQVITTFQKNHFYPSFKKPPVYTHPNVQEVNS